MVMIDFEFFHARAPLKSARVLEAARSERTVYSVDGTKTHP